MLATINNELAARKAERAAFHSEYFQLGEYEAVA
jgi:hypothetical protein